jgi:Family of unknown function (DUF5989)
VKYPDSNPDNESLFKETSNLGFFSEFWAFLKTSKKWWMLPMLLLFLLMSVILILAKTAAAPFIYTLF